MSDTNELNIGWGEAYEAMASDVQNVEPEFLWDQRPHPFIEELDFIRRLRDKRVETIIDAGCGDGRNSLFLGQCGFSVLGIDVSKKAVEIARHRVINASLATVNFSVDDICDMRIVGPVDAILCADALGQVPDPTKAIEEFYRVLRPGGVLVANVYDTDDDTYGVGRPHPELNESFIYKNTLFRFFNNMTFRSMFSGHWINLEIRKSAWFDPPHGEYRPTPHHHSSLVVWAEKLRENSDD